MNKSTEIEINAFRNRQQIPDEQIKDVADQYEKARQVLRKLPPLSGVLWPLINNAAVAVELYLKSLNSELEYELLEDKKNAFQVKTKPSKRGHVLTKLFDGLSKEVRIDLQIEFADKEFNEKSINEALKQIERAFSFSRYPFEPNSEVSILEKMDLLMDLSQFFSNFVTNYSSRETIHWNES